MTVGHLPGPATSVGDFLAAARDGHMNPAMVGDELARARRGLHTKYLRCNVEAQAQAAAGEPVSAPHGPAWEDYQLAATGAVPGLLDTIDFLMDALRRIDGDDAASPAETVLRPDGTDTQRIAAMALAVTGRPSDIRTAE
jgi:hypothetical protein